MKGIAFTVITEITIAIIAIGIFLVLLQTLISGTNNTSLCPLYHGLRALPIPDYLKPYNPECEGVDATTKRLILKRNVTDELLVEYIMKCWKKSDYGKAGVDMICYELFLPEVKTQINETTLTEVLIDKELCSKLPNNFLEVEGKNFECGKENKLLWKIGNIKGEDITVIIKFDAFNHRINII